MIAWLLGGFLLALYFGYEQRTVAYGLAILWVPAYFALLYRTRHLAKQLEKAELLQGEPLGGSGWWWRVNYFRWALWLAARADFRNRVRHDA